MKNFLIRYLNDLYTLLDLSFYKQFFTIKFWIRPILKHYNYIEANYEFVIVWAESGYIYPSIILLFIILKLRILIKDNKLKPILEASIKLLNNKIDTLKVNFVKPLKTKWLNLKSTIRYFFRR